MLPGFSSGILFEETLAHADTNRCIQADSLLEYFSKEAPVKDWQQSNFI
jgi:hypothetical protein